MINTTGFSFDSLEHPLEHTGIFTKPRPDKLAVFVSSEPIHTKDFGQTRAGSAELLTKVQPMRKIIGHVVATKRKHRKRITTDHALLAGGCGRGLAAHGGRHVHALLPVAGLGHQWHRGGTSSSKNKCINDHTLRVVPALVNHRILRGRYCKSSIGVRRLAAL